MSSTSPQSPKTPKTPLSPVISGSDSIHSRGSSNSELSAYNEEELSLTPSQCRDLPERPTEEHIQNVKNSWNRVRDNLNIGDNVYKVLFARAPRAMQLFKRFNPQSQSRAFVVMLGFVVNSLSHPATLIPNLIKLGKRHVVYRVTLEDYHAMQDAVLTVLQDQFGAEWNGDLENSWFTVFSYISAVMLTAEHAGHTSRTAPKVTDSPSMVGNSYANANSPIVKEGWLEKLSAGKTAFFRRSTFSKRYVELRGATIFYFKKKGQSPPTGAIELTPQCDVQEYASKPYAFTVVTPKDPVTFMTAGDIEKDEWWEAIKKTIHNLNKAQDDSVFFQGDAIPRLGLADFEMLRVVGKGSYGKVYKARQKDTGEIFAIKALKKESLLNLAKYQDLELSAERKILQKIKHPFVVQLHHAFFTETKLYLVMDFLQGGVLLWHMNHRRQQPSKGLADSDVQFYSAEVVCALHHLHSFGIIYRDLKPENLILDKHGHVVLTDFGLATTKGQGIMMCGSAPFMAPEIVKRQPYSEAVDWWSLGVLMYEMMCGSRLFSGRGDEVFAKILTMPVRFPAYFKPEFTALLTCMLTREPSLRITGEEVMQHPWFSRINWELLQQRQVAVPFIPDHTGSDLKYFEPCSQDESVAVGSAQQQQGAGGAAPAPAPAPSKPHPDQSPVIKALLEDFPHNSRVTVLSQEEYGQPIIGPDGSIRTGMLEAEAVASGGPIYSPPLSITSPALSSNGELPRQISNLSLDSRTSNHSRTSLPPLPHSPDFPSTSPRTPNFAMAGSPAFNPAFGNFRGNSGASSSSTTSSHSPNPPQPHPPARSISNTNLTASPPPVTSTPSPRTQQVLGATRSGSSTALGIPPNTILGTRPSSESSARSPGAGSSSLQQQPMRHHNLAPLPQAVKKI